jgi:fructose-bisphosphate aldolase class II
VIFVVVGDQSRRHQRNLRRIVEEIVEGIKHGVRKVNIDIDIDLRLASTGAMRRLMATNPSEFEPRKFFGATVTAMRDVCIARYEAFGTAGNASKIKPISSEAMYQRYLKGELNAKVN